MPYTPEHRIGAQQSKGFQFKCLNGASPGFTVGQQGPTGALKSAMDTWETAWGTPIELVAIGTNTNFGAQSSTWLASLSGETRFKLFAVSLVPQSGGSITKLLNGDYDSIITAMYGSMISAGINGLDVCHRIGWEFNTGSAGDGSPGAYPTSRYNSGFPWATGHVDSQTGTANGIAQVHLAQAYFENLIRGSSIGYTGYIEWNGGSGDTSALSIANAMPTHATGVNKTKTLWGWDLYPGPPFNVGKDNVSSTWTAINNIYNNYLTYCRANGYMMGHGEIGQTYSARSPFSLNDVLTYWPLLYAKLAANADTVAYSALYHQNQKVSNPPPNGWPNYTDLNILDESHQMWVTNTWSGTASTVVGSGPYPVGASTFNSQGSQHTEATMGSIQNTDTTPSSWSPTTDANKQNSYTSFMNTFGGNVAGKGSPGLQAPVNQPNTGDSAPATDVLSISRNLKRTLNDYGTKNMIANSSLDLATTNWFTSGTGTVTRDTTIFRTTPASLKWTPGATLGSLQYYSVAAEPGTYTLSAWMYVPSGSGLTSIDCGIVSYTGINNLGYIGISQTTFSVTVFDAWFQVSTTLPSMAAGVTALGPKLIPHGSGIFYVDDVQLEHGSSVTSVAPLDAVVASTHRVTSIGTTDLTTTSDAVTRVRSYVRNTSDSAPATDAVVEKNVTVTRLLSDTAPAVGTFTRALSASRSVSQSVAGTDSVSRTVSHVYLRSLSDSAAATDVVGLGLQISRLTSDIASSSDALAGQISYTRAVSETYPVGEVMVEHATTARSLSESTTLAETLTRIDSVSRVVSDTAHATDAVTRNVTTARTVTTTIPTSESIVGRGGQNRSLSDTVTPVTDTVVRALSASRKPADPTFVFDALSRSVAVSRSTSETTTVGDATFRRSVSPSRTTNETLVVADAVGHAAATVRGVSESLPFLVDTVTRSGGAAVNRFFTDFAHATDGAQGSKGNSRALTDHVNGSDAATRVVLVYVGLGDHTAALDACSRVLVTARATVDHTVVNEVLTRHISGLRVLTPSKFGPVRGRPGRQAVLTSPTTRARPGPTMIET